MKKVMICAIALLGLAVVGLTSCKDDNKGGKLDPDAMISIRPAAGVKSGESNNPERLTAKEVVEQATDIWYWNKAIYAGGAIGRGFAPSQRDIANLRLLMWGFDIIKQDGSYAPDFIESEDIILTISRSVTTMDTIAYIPNAVLRTAQPLIKAAHAAGDYTECYRLFDQAFTFIPITGAEWLELKKQGKN